MYELLPCPFCGSTDLDHNLDNPGYDGVTNEFNYWIECFDCPCNMEVYGDNVYEIIEKWNTRI